MAAQYLMAASPQPDPQRTLSKSQLAEVADNESEIQRT